MFVYVPNESGGAIPALPARVNASGHDEITLLPRLDRTQSTTPSVIMKSDTSSRMCCHRNDTVLSFVGNFILILVMYEIGI